MTRYSPALRIAVVVVIAIAWLAAAVHILPTIVSPARGESAPIVFAGPRDDPKPAPTVNPVVQPRPVHANWMHTAVGKPAVLVAFVVIVGCLIAGTFAGLQKPKRGRV